MPEFGTQAGGNIYEGGANTFVLVTCMVAAMGGLIFGYDIGISGGVTSMEQFLTKFFPLVHKRMTNDMNGQNQYCKFNSQLLTLFTSSLYISALVSAFFASNVTRALGRKASMCCGGIFCLIGSLLNGTAINITMLIIGRILLGIGIGFNNQSIPVYLSEIAPATIRGAINIGFQLFITTGILIANLVNYGTLRIEGGWGWRVSLAFAAVPALIMTVGSLFLVETPNSILERGQMEQAKLTLQKIRGTNNVQKEFQELVNASHAAKKLQHPWENIIQPRYRPQLVVCILIPFFQQFTGINVVMFYTPVILKTLGFGDESALLSAVSTGAVNVFATVIAISSVDKYGRRALFLEGGLQMMVCQIAIGVLIGIDFGLTGEGDLSKSDANLILILICTYVAAFAWSWGPLGWLIPSEICPLEIRSAGQALSVSVNMFFTFVIAQSFLSMLCHMKFGIFFFFAAFLVLMTIIIYFFLPETKNVPIEEMNEVWKEHWFWGKYFSDETLLKSHGIGTSTSL